MIHLYEGDNDVYLTLKEKCVLVAPNYLFRFIHRTTGEEVVFVKKNAADTSTFKNRFNLFSISDSEFTTAGQYAYYVYEQSTSNTDYTLAALVESGIMHLHSEDLTYNTYQTKNTYVTR